MTRRHATKAPRLYPGPSFADAASPTGYSCELYDLNDDAQFVEWEQAWADHLGTKATGDAPATSTTRKARTQGEPDPERSKRQAEAVAYIASYRGSWGLILDLRANEKWGTKWFRLSDRQIEVVLNARDRDLDRADDRAYDAWLAHEAQPVARPSVVVDNTPHDVAAPIEDGVYLVDGDVLKVVHAVHGSGNQYAKRFDPDSRSFVYAKGAIRSIRPEHRMTLEQAAAFGALYGCCMNCGRTLTDETSIAAAIGPVCAKRFVA